jgi:hypothetical protein
MAIDRLISRGNGGHSWLSRSQSILIRKSVEGSRFFKLVERGGKREERGPLSAYLDVFRYFFECKMQHPKEESTVFGFISRTDRASHVALFSS